MYLWTNRLKIESESSGWLMEFTNLPPLNDKRRLRRNRSVRGFRKRGKPFRQKWSLPLSWSVESQAIWIDYKMNWFTIQPRTHRKPIWIGLWVGIWRFRCLKTLNILLKSRNCNAVIIFKLPAVLWVEIMFMNGCYDNNSSCEFRYINKDFK